MSLRGELAVAAGRSGIVAFCSFNIVWLWKEVLKTLVLAISVLFTLLLNSRGGTGTL